jgi:hypothetical protein
MGAFNSTPQTETINWKNINTNDMSEIPNLYGISAEANKLVEQLNLPQLSESTSNTTNIDDYFLTKVNNSTNNQLSENLSSTSPFISSEMYNFVMDKYQKQHNIKNSMIGGSKNNLDDDSDTSSTSSSSKSSENKSDVESEKKPVHKKSAKNKIVNKKLQKKATEDFMEYLSSSAHTGGSITESSVLNENTITVSSVRTSQINLISE